MAIMVNWWCYTDHKYMVIFIWTIYILWWYTDHKFSSLNFNWNIIYFAFIWEIFLLGTEFKVESFFLQTLKKSVHCFLVCMVSGEKYIYVPIFAHLYTIYLILWLLVKFSLYLLSNLVMIFLVWFSFCICFLQWFLFICLFCGLLCFGFVSFVFT